MGVDRAALKARRDALYRDPHNRPPRPPFDPEGIPDELARLPQWVVWRYAWDADKGKWDKPPLRVNGVAASSTNP